jgi:DNA-binding NtrC family response regulator
MDRVQSGMTLDLLLLDLPQADGDGLQVVRWLRRLRPALPIVLIGYVCDNGRKEELIRMGVRDYLIRPFDNRQLRKVLQRNLFLACEDTETNLTSDDVEPVGGESFFIGVSPIMRKLRAQAALLAEANVPVLILGEEGSGRETTARLVHRLSVRSGFEFATVNCVALPGDLLEKELFGYERSCTNAVARTKTGKLELCAGGTILLNEITEMPLVLQASLVQVMQNKRFIRPGTCSSIETDVRVVAVSSKNVERAIAENRLREDLYHRLSSYTIYVPPLRERKEELYFLLRHFMHRLAKHYGLSQREFSPAIIEAWHAYDWPGNLQELEDCVKQYLFLGDEELALVRNRSKSESGILRSASAKERSAFQVAFTQGQSSAGNSGSKSLRSLIQRVKSEAEKNAIAAALEKTAWNRKAAARLLDVSYRTVLYKIEQYKMTSPNSSVFPAGNEIRNMAAGFRGNGKTG